MSNELDNSSAGACANADKRKERVKYLFDFAVELRSCVLRGLAGKYDGLAERAERNLRNLCNLRTFE
jgi:hypothetical protein